MMTIKELIKELKKYPPTSYVGVNLHDNHDNELQGIVYGVVDFDPETAEYSPTYCKNVFVVLNI